MCVGLNCLKNLCLSLVSGVLPLLFRTTPLPRTPLIPNRSSIGVYCVSFTLRWLAISTDTLYVKFGRIHSDCAPRELAVGARRSKAVAQSLDFVDSY